MATTTYQGINNDLLREYLRQAPTDNAATSVQDHIRARAYSIINEHLGFTFAAYPGSASAKVVYGQGGSNLYLPAHMAGSVTTVTDEGGGSVTGWSEDADGSLHLTTTFPPSIDAPPMWRDGARYTVTAKWGYGPAPESIVELEIELCVNIYRERDKGSFSDVVGVEGGGAVAVGYQRALTNRQQMIIDTEKAKFMGVAYF